KTLELLHLLFSSSDFRACAGSHLSPTLSALPFSPYRFPAPRHSGPLCPKKDGETSVALEKQGVKLSSTPCRKIPCPTRPARGTYENRSAPGPDSRIVPS